MPFSKGDNNINRQGRPKNSLNNTTLIKKEILSQLSSILSEQMQKEVIEKTLSMASPSARLRFIEGCLKYIIPVPTMEGELDTILEQLEKIKDEKKAA
jgi:hypothetical protein